MEKGCEASSHSKTCHKIPGGKSPLAPARLGTRVSKMAGSFLLKPEGMAGLQRPFIKMNYEPMRLSGWIWPRLGGRGPLAPCLRGLKPSSSPPRLLPTPLSTPYPCLMKEKGIYPSRGSPRQEVNFNLRKLFFL